MDTLPCMQKQNTAQNPRRYRIKKFSVVLSQMQTGNLNSCHTIQYDSYQRARRTDAEPITRSQEAHGLSALFF